MRTNWVGWTLSVFTLLLLLAFGALLATPVRLLITGERAEGVVVVMAEKGASQSSMVEFVSSSGERVRVNGRSFFASNALREGEAVGVAYNPLQPQDAHLLLLSEFGGAGLMLGFIGFVLLIWICVIVVSEDPANGDPFKLLSAVILRYDLTPRFALFFFLSIVIPACGLATYELSKRALDLRFNGVKAVGKVVASNSKSTTIAFKDASGKEFEIQGSSGLSTRDVVEVIYVARHPDEGSVNTWDQLYLAPLFFGSVLLAFLVLLRLVLSGSIEVFGSGPGNQRKLKTSGVPAVATVIEANPETRLLRYRIDKETRIPGNRMPTENLDNFISLERAFSDWKPFQAAAGLRKGDQFRAYLDSQKPGKNFYVDFGERIGHNSFVKSMEDESIEDEEYAKELVGKLRNLATLSSPYLSQESLSEILNLIDEDELSLAFEKLVTKIMSLSKPLPAPLQRVDWDEVSLGFNEESEDDPEFWEKFRAFVNELK